MHWSLNKIVSMSAAADIHDNNYGDAASPSPSRKDIPELVSSVAPLLQDLKQMMSLEARHLSSDGAESEM